ncbi:MAG: DUF5060 domain-containing protein [Bacteroidota bacterium]
MRYYLSKMLKASSFNLIILLLCFLPVVGQQLEDKTGYLNQPYLEWEIQWSNYEDNPYDVEAVAVFTHQSSEKKKLSQMYYAGNDTWRFRFTGTMRGRWNVVTSGPGNLGGKKASVTIEPAQKEKNGFLGADGKRWLWTGSGEEHLPQLVMRKELCHYWTENGVDTAYISQSVEEFIHETGFTGFHIPDVGAYWFDINSSSSDTRSVGPDANPDPRAFKILENIILSVYHAGASTHIWLWGSDAFDWGGHSGPGGIGGPMGVADQRLLRYIAARLGPLPGWSMGYGFDLHPWAESGELEDWYDFLESRLGGWQHMLGARADTFDMSGGANRRAVSSVYWKGDYVGHYDYRIGYPWYVEVLKSFDKPQFQEDRFRIRRKEQFQSKDYTPQMTVRGLWHSTMAGGVANIWGNLLPHNDNDRGSRPYDNRESTTIRGTRVTVDIKDAISTYSTFWFEKERFSYDYIRDNELTGNKTGNDQLTHGGAPISVCLRNKSSTRYIFYSEDAEKVIMDLRGSDAPIQAVAVDTRKSYREIDLGKIDQKKFVWEPPYASDWAVAVGKFNKVK